MTKTELLELKERLKFVETHGFQVARPEYYAAELEAMGAERASDTLDASCLLMMVSAVLDGNVKVAAKEPEPVKEEAPAKTEESEPVKLEEEPKAEESSPNEEELKAPENHSELDLGAASVEEEPKAEAEEVKAEDKPADKEASKPAKAARQTTKRST